MIPWAPLRELPAMLDSRSSELSVTTRCDLQDPSPTALQKTWWLDVTEIFLFPAPDEKYKPRCQPDSRELNLFPKQNREEKPELVGGCRGKIKFYLPLSLLQSLATEWP